MTKNKLTGKRIAILLCDGFEETEMTKPYKMLQDAGATLDLISPNDKFVKGWKHDHWTKKYKVNVTLKKADPNLYDAIVLPGGVMNPDKLRTNKLAIKFIQHFLKKKKLVSAICHGPWTLLETKKMKGRAMTSYHSIKTDMINAGVKWKNKSVVVDDNLITSRQPSDIPDFGKAIITKLSKSL